MLMSVQKEKNVEESVVSEASADERLTAGM